MSQAGPSVDHHVPVRHRRFPDSGGPVVEVATQVTHLPVYGSAIYAFLHGVAPKSG
jgi:hypothetical protein